MVRWKFNSQLHYRNQRVYVCVYTRNGTAKRSNLNSIQERRLSPAQVCSDARNPRFEESWISNISNRARLYANAPVSIPSPFYRRPHCYFARSSFSLHPHPPLSSSRAHVLPRLTFLRIMGNPTPQLSFINSPDKLIHDAGDGLINLPPVAPLPWLRNDRWIARTVIGVSFLFPSPSTLARHRTMEPWSHDNPLSSRKRDKLCGESLVMFGLFTMERKIQSCNTSVFS